jgi:hypothetical protein
VEFIDCNGHAQRQLIVRAFQRSRGDFADLPQAIENGMPVNVQR